MGSSPQQRRSCLPPFGCIRPDQRTPPSTLAVALGWGSRIGADYDERGGMGSVKIGILLGVGAGLLFGIAFTLTSETSEAAGLSPVLIQRVSGLLFLVALQRVDKAPMLALSIPARKWAIGSGVAGGVALGSLRLGYIKGTAGRVVRGVAIRGCGGTPP